LPTRKEVEANQQEESKMEVDQRATPAVEEEDDDM